MNNHKSLPKSIIQLICFWLLTIMIFTDKILNLIDPPLQDLWYYVIFCIACGFETYLLNRVLWWKR